MHILVSNAPRASTAGVLVAAEAGMFLTKGSIEDEIV